jgi:hypothetical protein
MKTAYLAKPKQKVSRLLRETSAPAPYAHAVTQEESGETPNASLPMGLIFNAGYAENVDYASQIQTTSIRQRKRLKKSNLLKQLIRSH